MNRFVELKYFALKCGQCTCSSFWMSYYFVGESMDFFSVMLVFDGRGPLKMDKKVSCGLYI